MLLQLACACSSKETTKKKNRKTKKTEDVDDREPGGKGSPVEVLSDGTRITVEYADTANITWIEYTDPYGYTTINVPDTWKVDYIMSDLITFGLLAQDKNNPDRFFFFELFASPFLKSKEAHDIWQTYFSGDYEGGENMFVLHPYLSTPTTEGFFRECGPEYLSIYNYTKVATLEEQNPMFGEIIEGTFQAPTGNYVTSLCTAQVLNMAVQDVYGVDCGWYGVSDIIIMAAPEADYTNWVPVMSQMLNSLKFSQDFLDDRNREWYQINQTMTYISSVADQMGDMIMDSWNNSNDTYDIISQRQSDATLGRERVYDKDTGEIYYAPNGFSDLYDGDRYEPLGENDQRYRDPVVGTLSYG